MTAFGRQREEDLVYQGTERLGVLAHELRNLLQRRAPLVRRHAKRYGRAQGEHEQHACAQPRRAHALVERSLTEVRLGAGAIAFQETSLSEFLEELAIRGAMEAEARGLRLIVSDVDPDLHVKVDRQLLASAITNVLQNAFKFTRPSSKVVLSVREEQHRVLIEVADECGGLPSGDAEEMFTPFTSKGHGPLGARPRTRHRAARRSGEPRHPLGA